MIDKFTEKLVRLVSGASSFISKNCIIFGLILMMILMTVCMRLFMVERLQRLKSAIWKSLYNYEDENDGADDEGFIEDDDLFRDLNPEQSVELHRRQRFEAVLRNWESEGLIKLTNKPASPKRRETIRKR
ncbi:hypothetical protein KR084_008673 [Drosophila pseudotakahashii]|nr:hypothetical protein KR084_008673 [Drosophila pseudotakahashii]